jgi:hypothetical protein
MTVPPVPTPLSSPVERAFFAAASALLLERCGAGHAFRGATLLAAGRAGATIQVPVSPPHDAPQPARRRQLRVLIVEQLAAADRPRRGAALARSCGRRYNSHFRTVIAGLESEGVVAPIANGYWLAARPLPGPVNPPAEQNLPPAASAS